MARPSELSKETASASSLGGEKALGSFGIGRGTDTTVNARVMHGWDASLCAQVWGIQNKQNLGSALEGIRNSKPGLMVF